MKTLKTIASSILTASFVFSPAALVLAEEATVTATAKVEVAPVTATTGAITVSATATPAVTSVKTDREAIQNSFLQKVEEARKIEGAKNEVMRKATEAKKEALNNLKEKREDLKDVRKASSTEVRKERREEEMKRKMASTTEKLSVLSTRLTKLGVDIKASVSAQASSSLVITSAMTKVEARSAFKTFLLGSDYKNLGELVSEAAKTTSRINQIENQISKMASTSDKTALVASLAELKTQAATIEQYVKDNEGKFSLFGWLAKRFNK